MAGHDLDARPSDDLRGEGSSQAGSDEVDEILRWLAARWSDSTLSSFDLVASDVSGDLAYVVGFEHIANSVAGVPVEPYTLRVTHIFRQEAASGSSRTATPTACRTTRPRPRMHRGARNEGGSCAPRRTCHVRHGSLSSRCRPPGVISVGRMDLQSSTPPVGHAFLILIGQTSPQLSHDSQAGVQLGHPKRLLPFFVDPNHAKWGAARFRLLSEQGVPRLKLRQGEPRHPSSRVAHLTDLPCRQVN